MSSIELYNSTVAWNTPSYDAIISSELVHNYIDPGRLKRQAVAVPGPPNRPALLPAEGETVPSGVGDREARAFHSTRP